MFGTSGVRGDLDALPPRRMQRIGAAVATCFDRVVVGRDGRLTASTMEDAFVSGVQSRGAEVLLLGEVPTNVVAWNARYHEAGGAMLTASHNPPEDAGVKLFDTDGGEAGEDVEERVSASMEAPTVDWSRWTEAEDVEGVRPYVDAAVEHLKPEMDGGIDLEVAVDAGCGVSACATVPLLERLGCDVTAVNAQSDGRFPSRPSKPAAGTLGGFVDLVLRGDHDAGFAHDGDGDRLVVVDREGLVSEDGVLAALARRLVNSTSSDLVTTTPNTSTRIDDAVEAVGGTVERVPLGGLPEAMRNREPAFASEPWKPAFPEFGPWIDGSVGAAYVAVMLAEDPGVFDGLRDIEIRKTSVPCPEDRKEEVMEELSTVLPERFGGDVDSSYGVRVQLEDIWFLVRPSGTEPLIRVYAEAGEDLLEDVADDVQTAVVGADG